MKYWYMLVEGDEYQLPKCPPFESLKDIATNYGLQLSTVAKAVKRESQTPYGVFVRCPAPKKRANRKRKYTRKETN